MKLHILFPLHFKVQRISYTCWHLSVNIDSAELPVDVIVPSYSDLPAPSKLIKALPGNQLWRLIGKINRSLVARVTEKVFVSRVNPGDIVYLWTNVSDELLAELAKKDVLIIKEKINSLKIDSIRILNSVYEKAGLAPNHGITEQEAYAEIRQFEKIDRVFIANPIAEKGMYAQGISKEKVLPSSYGWDPTRYGNTNLTTENEQPFTAAFLGVAMLRKGVDLMLEAWSRSKVKGRLLIIGNVDEEIKKLCATYLDRDDVTVTGWLYNPADVLSTADVFVFPTHEEGGPLVTYEVMGQGLPVIVSPYGAGAIARHMVDGFVIDPYEIDEWANAFNKLASDRDLLKQYSENAKLRAREYTWEKVGQRRKEQLLSIQR